MTAHVLTAAQHLASMGISVFPCGKRSKEPFGPLVPHGVLDATCDEGTIGSWFYPASTLNIGATGLVFIDLDEPGPSHPTLTIGGAEELARLERTHGALPPTPRHLSPTGGSTLYFSLPARARVRNGALTGCEGIDVKGPGAYVLVPPSTHPLGGQYVHDVGAHLDDVPIAELPAWVVSLASGRTGGARLTSTSLDARLSVLGAVFAALGGLGDVLPDGRRPVRCPWLAQHSDGRGDGRDTSTVIFPRSVDSVIGGFRCSHSHCTHRTWRDVLDLVPTKLRNAATIELAAELRRAS